MPSFKQRADAWLDRNNGLTTLLFLGVVITPIIWLLASGDKTETATHKLSNESAKVLSDLEAEIITLLDHHGRSISSNSENHAIVYVKSYRIPDSSISAYKSIFRTSHEGLMSLPGADEDRAAYAQNIARTEVWQAAFCKPEIKAALSKHGLSVISANLENADGEVQSMAVCATRS